MPYKCPIKQKEAQHRSYLRNKKITIERSMKYKHDNQVWFKKTKLKDVSKGCSCCGYMGHPDEFDYHHRDPSTKILAVSDMLGTYGRPKVIAEMAKCDIVCKPCHEQIHYPNYPFHP
tara:strand:- start:896 stop:1246 length:351 start_codon:yes stop_codon:yes gene_type:complete